VYSLTSAIDGGEWTASRSSRFTTRERAPGTHWIRGWVGPRACLDAVVKRKIPSPCRDSNSRASSAIPLSYPGSSFQYKLRQRHAHSACHHLQYRNEHQSSFWRKFFKVLTACGCSQVCFKKILDQFHYEVKETTHDWPIRY